VRTYAAVFAARPSLAEIKVDFEGNGSVPLTAGQLEGQATVHMPIKSFVLQAADAGTYTYRVTTTTIIGEDMSTSTGDLRTNKTPDLTITLS
jgi:hypothetical protein